MEAGETDCGGHCRPVQGLVLPHKNSKKPSSHVKQEVTSSDGVLERSL